VALPDQPPWRLILGRGRISTARRCSPNRPRILAGKPAFPTVGCTHAISPSCSIMSGSLRYWWADAITPPAIRCRARADIGLSPEAQRAAGEHSAIPTIARLRKHAPVVVTQTPQPGEPFPHPVMSAVGGAETAQPQRVKVDILRQAGEHPLEIARVERVHPPRHDRLGQLPNEHRRHHQGCALTKLPRRARAGFSAGYARDPGRAISGRGLASVLPGRAARSCAPQRGHASPSAHSTTAGTANLQTEHRMRTRSTTAPELAVRSV
jgi:hypothetical protein